MLQYLYNPTGGALQTIHTLANSAASHVVGASLFRIQIQDTYEIMILTESQYRWSR